MPAASTSMPDFTGYMVDQRYQLVRLLGSGTYGVVYHAVDTRAPPNGSSAARAVKLIRKSGRKPSEHAAARREIALHGLVSNHPNVVTVYAAYEDDDYFYIVMDLCRGGDLFEPICRRVYVDNDDLIRTAFISLIDAVEACHNAKVYHRDLKPENILVNEDRSQLYLADFGMATNRSVVEEFYCGTAAYMSPECIGRMSGYKPYSPPCSDVWALGVILVNMISGRNPWERATLTDLCFSQFIENPDFLFEMLQISEGANDIFRRAFVLNPLHRITLQELRQAVLNVDTFFRYEDELGIIDEYAREVEVAPTFGNAPSASRTRPDVKVGACGGGAPVEVDLADLKPDASAQDVKLAFPVARLSLYASCNPTLPVPEFPGFSSGSSESDYADSGSSSSSPTGSMIATPENTVGGVGCVEEDVTDVPSRLVICGVGRRSCD